MVHHNLAALDEIRIVAEDVDGKTDHLRLLGGHSIGQLNPLEQESILCDI